MSDHQRMEPIVEEWLKRTSYTPYGTKEGMSHVMARVPQVRQRRRWWWPLPEFTRTQPTTIDDTTAYQPSPIPATNGHTPTVIGRTQSMLSPAKAITAGAIVFAIGGVMLIAQPFQQQSSVPGAETQAIPTPVGFSSTYEWRNQMTPGSSETLEDGVTVVTGEGWAFSNLDSSDPRFAGPLAVTSNYFEYPGEGSVSIGGYRIETADGAWQQVPAAGVTFEGDESLWRSGQLPPADNIQFWTFIGEGDYEGLIAVVQETWWPDGGDEVTIRFDGYIIDGDLPDAPVPWMP